jgi:hypothetical protein
MSMQMSRRHESVEEMMGGFLMLCVRMCWLCRKRRQMMRHRRREERNTKKAFNKMHYHDIVNTYQKKPFVCVCGSS